MDTITSAKRTIEIEINALEKIIANLDEDFETAIHELLARAQIILTGVGKSGYIAKKIAATMASYGFNSSFLDPVEALHGDMGIVGNNSAVIFLSKSGTTTELLNLLPFLQKRNTFIIGILGKNDTPLAEKSNISLTAEVEEEACPFDMAPTASTTAALALGDALSVAMAEVKGLRPRDFAYNHPGGQLGRISNLQVSDVMQKGDKLPIVSENAKFRQTIIKMSEKSLGCACILDSDGKILGLITDGDIRRTLEEYENIDNLSAGDIMTKDPISIPSSMMLSQALSIMETRSSQISILAVHDESEKFVGILRIHDILGNSAR